MNRSFHSPGLTINSVRVIGPEFTHPRVDQLNYSLRSQASNLSMQSPNGSNHASNLSMPSPNGSNHASNLSVPSPSRDDTINSLNTTGSSFNRSRPSMMNSDSNNLSKPSPDEIVIKGRGRRSLPVKWSPIPIESPQKTPLSTLIRKSPKKGIITLRSSPRKRLQLTDDPTTDLIRNRKSLLSTSPLARKTSASDMVSSTSKVSNKSVDKLSKDQLVHVLNSIIESHPFIKDEIEPILNTKESNSRTSRNALDNNSNNNCTTSEIDQES